MYYLETFFQACHIESMDGVRLREWRKALGWSQIKAGEELGLSRSTIIRYEQGESITFPKLLGLACKHLNGFDPETLAKLDDNRGTLSRSEWIREKIHWHHNTGRQKDERQEALRSQPEERQGQEG